MKICIVGRSFTMYVTSPTPSLNSFFLVPIVFLGVPLPLSALLARHGYRTGVDKHGATAHQPFLFLNKFLSHVSQEITRELDSRESVRQEEG